MSRTIVLRWHIFEGEGENRNKGRKESPDWEDVLHRIDMIKSRDGTLNLEDKHELNEPHKWLRLQKIDEMFQIAILGTSESGEKIFRLSIDMSIPKGRVDWGGDDCSARVLSSDFEMCTKIFRQFFFEGDVSEDLMTRR